MEGGSGVSVSRGASIVPHTVEDDAVWCMAPPSLSLSLFVAFSPFFPPFSHPAVFSCLPNSMGESRIDLVVSGERVQVR